MCPAFPFQLPFYERKSLECLVGCRGQNWTGYAATGSENYARKWAAADLSGNGQQSNFSRRKKWFSDDCESGKSWWILEPQKIKGKSEMPHTGKGVTSTHSNIVYASTLLYVSFIAKSSSRRKSATFVVVVVVWYSSVNCLAKRQGIFSWKVTCRVSTYWEWVKTQVLNNIKVNFK